MFSFLYCSTQKVKTFNLMEGEGNGQAEMGKKISSGHDNADSASGLGAGC
jgi:hypothetical protein